MRGGSVALYVFLYSLGFLFNTLHLLSGTLSVVLYLSYTALMAWGIYLAMGTVGFLCVPPPPPFLLLARSLARTTPRTHARTGGMPLT